MTITLKDVTLKANTSPLEFVLRSATMDFKLNPDFSLEAWESYGEEAALQREVVKELREAGEWPTGYTEEAARCDHVHAGCTCPKVEVTTFDSKFPEYIAGMHDPGCPVHGA
jgi:hypothetical protein